MSVARLSHGLKALQQLYPVQLAGSWDNVGLLVDVASEDDPQLEKIFFCNDLVIPPATFYNTPVCSVPRRTRDYCNARAEPYLVAICRFPGYWTRR